MRAMLADFSRLVILILFLPLFIIFIGPLLVLSVFRGHQRIGPLTLDSARYDIAGRAGIFMLGLAIWLLVWSGLAWLATAAISSPPLLAIQSPTVTPNLPTVAPVLPTDTVPAPTATPTLPPATPTATPTPSATAGVSTKASTASPSPTLVVTIEATETPLPTATTATVQPGPTLTATQFPPLTPADRLAAVATVEEANLLLQATIAQPTEENLANLESLWQDLALTNIKRFAVEQSQKYIRPFEVQFEYVSPPTITEQVSSSQLVISTTERWRYGGPSSVNEEAFEFIYTLNRRDDGWVVTRYTYRNLPRPTPTTIPLPTPTAEEN